MCHVVSGVVRRANKKQLGSSQFVVGLSMRLTIWFGPFTLSLSLIDIRLEAMASRLEAFFT